MFYSLFTFMDVWAFSLMVDSCEEAGSCLNLIECII